MNKRSVHVDVSDIDCPPTLPVVAIEVEDIEDQTGDDALHVTLVLSDDSDVDNATGADVIQLKRSVRDQIRTQDDERFAYITLVKESEWSAESAKD